MNRPYLLVNMAMTADGKIATANHRVSSFGSSRDREHLLELRATADAVMAGARTAGGEKITMGPGPARYRLLRTRNGLSPYNLRVIVSGSGRVDPEAEIFQHRFSPILVLTTQRAGKHALAKLKAISDEVKPFGARQINFLKALRWLRNKWGVQRLVCEGGGELNDALFRAGLVDELHLTICPFVFGGRTAPTIADGIGVLKLEQSSRLKLKSMKRRGTELFLVFDSVKSNRG